MPRLKITTGKQSGKTYEVSKATIIGRGDSAQIPISDNHASREHCKVFEQGGAWVVADLNSRNGFKVNGVQTTRKNLSTGDKIQIGETVIVFEVVGGPSAAAGDAKKAKEAAFAAARGGGAGSKRSAGSAPARSDAGEGSGLKVSDRVLQFNKVDTKNATVMDIDLAQSPGMSVALIWVGCLAFLGGVIWLVARMVA